jgi:predicted ATPase
VTIGSAVAEVEPDTLEELLEGLARRHRIIRPAGFRSYRNGHSSCYDFVHELYRRVVYNRIPLEGRRKLHKSVAENAARCGNRSRVGISVRIDSARPG